ncbi:helix-turn-helix transcriptional regulator [bacterium]|nr:helix-turn-helix transcriptional regulator [bacterium]
MHKDEKLKRKISKKIGTSIKFYRNKNNISQEKLAFSIGADRTYISALEQGSKCASIYCLYLIAQELNINIKDLLDMNIK